MNLKTAITTAADNNNNNNEYTEPAKRSQVKFVFWVAVLYFFHHKMCMCVCVLTAVAGVQFHLILIIEHFSPGILERWPIGNVERTFDQ